MTKWISVEDGLPECGIVVWVYACYWDGVAFRDTRQVGTGELGSGGWWDNWGDAIEVTHWQPYTQPEPPEDAQ